MPDPVRPPALIRWCAACGARLHAPAPATCAACGTTHWRNPKPCAGGLVVREGRLLLVRRAIDPWHGCWDIPGGFCDADEHPADAMVREVREEVGLEVEVIGFLGMWIDHYGPGSVEAPADVTLNCYFHARPRDARPPVVDPAELSAAAWFAPDELPGELAFPDHARQVLAAWRETLDSGAASP